MPTSLAEYRIIGPAGPPSARIWTAEPPRRLGLGSPVVVIELPGVEEDHWGAVRSRLAELATVQSSHLPRLLDWGRGDGDEPATWIARDRPDARPLAEVARSVETDRGLRALVEAARGADELHQAGFAHGDIRLETILVDDTGAVLDLPTGSVAVANPIVARVVVPTDLDGYEPDRLWGSGPTRASDVFALGAALHRLVTGTALHPDLTGDQTVTAVQRVLVERPRLQGGSGGPLGDLVGRCLDPDPGRRPSSAAELADQLDALVAA